MSEVRSLYLPHVAPRSAPAARASSLGYFGRLRAPRAKGLTPRKIPGAATGRRAPHPDEKGSEPWGLDRGDGEDGVKFQAVVGAPCLDVADVEEADADHFDESLALGPPAQGLGDVPRRGELVFVERPHRAGGLGDLGDQTGLAVRRVAQEKMKVLVEPGLNGQEDSLDAVGLELFAPAPAVRLPAGRRETDEVVDRRVKRVRSAARRLPVRY